MGDTLQRMFACRYCQAHMDAYLANELSRPARRRISAHIDRCPTCYTLYVQRRELTRDLRQNVPLVGHHHMPDFARLWQDIQAEVPRADTPHRMQYGLVALLLTLMLLVPLTMGHSDVMAAPPTQPAPQLAGPERTPARAAALPQPTTAAATLIRETAYFVVDTPPTLPEPDFNDLSRGPDGRND